MCISAFNAHNLEFLSPMAHGRVQNKIPHYAGPNSELDRSPRAPAGAQKCRFLTSTCETRFFAYITRGPQKDEIC